VRIGEGKRGNPYRHYKPENVSADLKDELAAEIKSAADDAATPDAQKDSAATRVPSGGNNTDGRAEGVELATSEDEKLSAATSTYRAAERNGERNPWPHNPMRFYDRGGGL
jgi:hypothetical protein